MHCAVVAARKKVGWSPQHGSEPPHRLDGPSPDSPRPFCRLHGLIQDMRTIVSPSRRKGSVIVYVVVIMTAVLGITTFAVDYGRMQLCKTQLRQAADAAALYAVTGLADSTYVNKAQSAASDNTCDGSAISLTSSDVVAGTWSNGTFTAGGFSPNAVKVTAQRVASRGTAIPLYFGQLLGINSCDVHASAIAIPSSGVGYGFVGLS